MPADVVREFEELDVPHPSGGRESIGALSRGGGGAEKRRENYCQRNNARWCASETDSGMNKFRVS